MFGIPKKHGMLQDLVAKFIDRNLIPLEKGVLVRQMSGQKSGLAFEEEQHLLNICKDLGLRGLDVPEEYSGTNLPYAPSPSCMKNRATSASPSSSPDRPSPTTCRYPSRHRS